MSRKVAFSGMLYLVPSLKTWPTSMARRIFSGLVHFTQGSPAETVRRSNHSVTRMSRSMDTLRKWKPSSFAPVVMSLAPRRRSSARTFQPAGTFRTAPSEPGNAPRAVKWTMSAAFFTSAGRASSAPVRARNLASFNWSSPRTRTSTGWLSAMYTRVLIWRLAGTP